MGSGWQIPQEVRFAHQTASNGMKTCYMCDNLATSREHVPPECFFPEQKDLNADYRRNLITVPACDVHNLRKSRDDEYMLGVVAFHWRNNQVAHQQSTTKIKRALKRKRGYFSLYFGEGKNQLLLLEDKKLVTGPVNIDRLNSSLEKIARGLYYRHFNRKWLNNVGIQHLSLVPVHNKDPNHPVVHALTQFVQQMRLLCLNQPKRGANPDVFYYQLVQGRFATIMLMVFYGGFEVIAVFDGSEATDRQGEAFAPED